MSPRHYPPDRPPPLTPWQWVGLLAAAVMVAAIAYHLGVLHERSFWMKLPPNPFNP